MTSNSESQEDVTLVQSDSDETVIDDSNESILGPADRIPMLRQVVVSDVSVRLPETFGRLTFSELDAPKRSLSIPISLEQAGIIAGHLSGRSAPRPMSGDLLCDIMSAFDLSVEVIQITGEANGIFLAQLTVAGAGSRPRSFPCRPSDGVIVALGQPLPVPILVDESLLS